jgi:K+-transporting ATPase KdpF subunit
VRPTMLWLALVLCLLLATYLVAALVRPEAFE